MHKKGISWQDLGQVWYQSMQEGVLTPESEFIDVRIAVLSAAKRCGFSDDNKSKIREAFNEVEIFDAQGSISGVVTGFNTGSKLQGASVRLYNHKTGKTYYSGETDSEGKFLASISPVKCRVLIAKDGYVSFNASYKIIESQDTSINVRLVNPGAGSVSGLITNAATGAPLEGVTLKIKSGWNITENEDILTFTTGADGLYSFNLGANGAGYYTIYMSKEGFADSSFNVTVSGSVTNQNASMSEGLEDNALRIVLEWGANPRDLDAHLVGELSDKSKFHVYYSSRNSYNSSGDIVANLDVDKVNGYGPETITLNTELDTNYQYFIHWYGGSGTWANSEAKVSVYVGNNTKPFREYNVPVNDPLANTGRGFWNVFTLSNGIPQAVNKLTLNGDPVSGVIRTSSVKSSAINPLKE